MIFAHCDGGIGRIYVGIDWLLRPKGELELGANTDPVIMPTISYYLCYYCYFYYLYYYCHCYYYKHWPSNIARPVIQRLREQTLLDLHPFLVHYFQRCVCISFIFGFGSQ